MAITPIAKNENTKVAPVAKLNAAPEFLTKVSLRNEPRIRIESRVDK